MSKEASSVEDTIARSAMKLALEALEESELTWKANDAINALEEALASEQEQRSDSEQLGEPVAWANRNDLTNFDMKVRTNGGPLHTVPLYTTPQQRDSLAEPRTWVGLTDDEVDLVVSASCKKDSSHLDAARVAREVEAKLKAKNERLEKNT